MPNPMMSPLASARADVIRCQRGLAEVAAAYAGNLISDDAQRALRRVELELSKCMREYEMHLGSSFIEKAGRMLRDLFADGLRTFK